MANLKNNTAKMQSILETVNALPEQSANAKIHLRLTTCDVSFINTKSFVVGMNSYAEPNVGRFGDKIPGTMFVVTNKTNQSLSSIKQYAVSYIFLYIGEETSSNTYAVYCQEFVLLLSGNATQTGQDDGILCGSVKYDPDNDTLTFTLQDSWEYNGYDWFFDTSNDYDVAFIFNV